MNTLQKQKNLYYLNYRGLNGSMLALDGIWGVNSIQATKNFQKDVGLVVDGIWGNNTENASINTWKQYQTKLNAYGYGLAVDGLCGNATINAIKTFQKSNGLQVDGIIGPATKEALNKSDHYWMTDEDWKKSKYFQKSEFACGCGGKYCDGYGNVKMAKPLIDNLNKIREHYGQPIVITSGIRCPEWNRREGGIYGSEHTKGKAADFYIRGGQSDSHNGRKEIVDYMITLPNMDYVYCNGYARTKGGTSYPSAPGMGNAVHGNV